MTICLHLKPDGSPRWRRPETFVLNVGQRILDLRFLSAEKGVMVREVLTVPVKAAYTYLRGAIPSSGTECGGPAGLKQAKV